MSDIQIVDAPPGVEGAGFFATGHPPHRSAGPIVRYRTGLVPSSNLFCQTARVHGTKMHGQKDQT